MRLLHSNDRFVLSAMQYGDRVMGPPSAQMSPRSYRHNKRLVADRATAQWEQKCLLGKLTTDKEPLSPENVAAIKGTGSLYDDNGFLEGWKGSNNSWRGRCPSPFSTRSSFQQSFPSLSKIVTDDETSTEAKWSGNKSESEDEFTIGKSYEKTADDPLSDKEISDVGDKSEDRFGGEDDFTDNFQLFRQAYRQWRMDGKMSK